ncbi:heme-degrading domain-containing protein [Tabrizicola sp.]|uniref:heme-degrading domain-containing protein n=1 Tax=Tabrizicola sp. TaxID=2005166 RepID=UPI003F380C7E
MATGTPSNVQQLQDELSTLVLPRFAEAEALRLGQILVGIAEAERLPVVIDIRTFDRTLFHAAMPGSAPLNGLWALRKSNTALMFQEASLLVGERNRAKGESLAKHGLDPAHYADHGGAVPIRVQGAGVVAVATVSGLPQLEDHTLVVRGIKALAAG